MDVIPAKSLLSVSFDDAIATVGRVEQSLADRKTPCHSGSALGSIFAKLRRLHNKGESLSDREWRIVFLKANHAVRIAHAIEAALEDPGSKEAIHRLVRSNMDLSFHQISQGKDSLWELDLYRRIKLGGTTVRFGEPDLIVSLGDALGEIGVACKKVYSEKNVSDSFRDGCEQIRQHQRPGIVALNLDDLLPENSVCVEPNQSALRSRLDAINRTFISSHKKDFLRHVQRGDCDGVVVITSVISDVPDMIPPINISRSSALWNDGASPSARLRCNAFLECLDKVIHQKKHLEEN